MRIFLIAFAFFCIISTLIPFLKFNIWWIRMFDFPHAQVTFMTLACLLGFFFLGFRPHLLDTALVVSLVIAFIYQAFIIFPYTPLSPKHTLDSTVENTDRQISILSSNVLIDNRETGKLKALISEYQPDIVLLLEPDNWWQKEMDYLKKEYPYTIGQPLDNAYGILLYSRLKLVNPQLQYRIKEDIPSIFSEVELPSGELVETYFIHPEPPSPTENLKSTARDAELLLVGKEIEKKNKPIIVTGDLNDVAWSHSTRLFMRISGLLDPRIGRGSFNTFHAKIPVLRWPLDHVFHTDHFQLINMERLPAMGSDHFPIYIKLSYEPHKTHQQDTPEADKKDEKEAQENINKMF